MSSIAVAIVNYNTREHLRACLASVFAEAPAQVIVADNGSSDGSIELIQRDFPAVELHVDPSNPGYGAAANQAVACCRVPYVLLLNSDTVLKPHALAAISSYLDMHPAVGILGPRLLNPDGTLLRSSFPFPTPWLPFLGQQPLVRMLARIPFLRERHVTAWSHNVPRRVPWVLGAALAIRREAFFQVEGFDKSFRMYFEDTDLCYRLGVVGWETHFAPAAEVVHIGHASTSQYPARMLRQLFLSSIHFYRQHYTERDLLLATAVTKLTIYPRILRDSILRQLRRSSAKHAVYDEKLDVWRQLLDDLR